MPKLDKKLNYFLQSGDSYSRSAGQNAKNTHFEALF
jgi:hypothetical protein